MKAPNARSVVMSGNLWQRVCQAAHDRDMSAGAFVRMALTAALEVAR